MSITHYEIHTNLKIDKYPLKFLSGNHYSINLIKLTYNSNQNIFLISKRIIYKYMYFI